MNSGGEWRVSLCPELVLSPETSAAVMQFPPVHGTVCPAFCFPGGMGAICVTRMQILEENKPGFLKEGRGLPIIGEAPAGEFAGRVMVQGMLGL